MTVPSLPSGGCTVIVTITSTVARQLISTTRADQIRERSIGLYTENKTRWTDSFRTVAGVRADTFHPISGS